MGIVENPVEMSRTRLFNVLKMSVYISLHRFRSPCDLLKNHRRFCEKGPIYGLETAIPAVFSRTGAVFKVSLASNHCLAPKSQP